MRVKCHAVDGGANINYGVGQPEKGLGGGGEGGGGKNFKDRPVVGGGGIGGRGGIERTFKRKNWLCGARGRKI